MSQVLTPPPRDSGFIANVHPRDWVNPPPAASYNLVVIGAGPAGLIAAAGAAGLGGKAALIERRFMGGDCLNVGCVPSKGILRAAQVLAEARNSAPFGVLGGSDLGFDFTAAMARMRALQTQISHRDAARRYRDELKIDLFLGEGSFSGPETITVAGKSLRFKKAAICSGASPALPAIPGLAAVGYLTNETIFSLTELPKRLAIIGGGPIGCELAQAFARFGSRVTLIEGGPQLLGREDGDAAELLQGVLRREGVDLELGVKILGIEGERDHKVLHLERGGEKFVVVADALLVAAGRTPNCSGLNLEKAGVEYDRSGVKVSDTLQTTNPKIYAAGDICSPFKFTHAADAQARILIANALFMGRQKVSRLTIPWCTYTDPEIAHVGLSEEEARGKGLALTTLTVPLAGIDRALLDGESAGFARVHLKKGTDKILGATIVARHAGEMINEITLAMTGNLGLGAIGRTIHPYPTQAEAIKSLADAYNRTRLTPRVQKLLALWLQWQRR